MTTITAGVTKGPPRGQPGAPSGGAGRPVAKIAVFGSVCLIALLAISISLIRSRRSGEALRKGLPAASTDDLALPPGGVSEGSYLLFRSTQLNREFGRLGVVASDQLTGPRFLAPLKCDRSAFSGGRGVCLTRATVGFLDVTNAIVFDAHFNELFTVKLAGFPSRVRVSPDGNLGAVTNFVTGDSYATIGSFSTRTDIIDLRTGKVLLDLEKMQVERDGKVMQGPDFNFWGVTFAKDSQRFYATLGTGDQTYLIQGDVRTRQATVLRAGVECPSLSPDNTRIAFKKRQPGSTTTWLLSVLDIETLADHPLAETRSVDDQAEWSDNDTVIYGLPENAAEVASLAAVNPGLAVISAGASIATDTWRVPASGGGTPERLAPGTWSASFVRSR